MYSRRTILGVLLLSCLANVAVLLTPWPQVSALGVYLLLVPLPGLLLAGLLLRRRRPLWMDHLLYGFGAGYGCAVVLMLVLSYLPGGLSGWTVLLAADLLLVALAMISWHCPWSSSPESDSAGDNGRIWVWIGAIILLVLAAFLRLANLGYAEFQGDEARAVLRAAAVIQGYEDVLFLHRKGPAEILLPAAPFTLVGRLDEVMARLPFAIANIVGAFAFFRLGTRLFNPLAGWIAAMLLVVDGYFIGFARIVQYQSLVLLATVLAVLILYDLYRRPRHGAGALVLAAWLLATGTLAHYEAALAVIPGAVLLVAALWRAKTERRELAIGFAWATLVGLSVLAFFYVPFVRHPNFADTMAYLTGERIGGSFPYNNLPLFFRQTIVYSSSYYVLLLVSTTAAGLVSAYWRGLGRRVAAAVAVLLIILLFALLSPREWLFLGGRDWMIVPVTLVIMGVWFLPKLRFEERLLWIWFGVIFIAAIFLVEKPNTHVYTFLLPWLLLVGMLLASAWTAVRERLGERPALVGGVAVASLLVLLFGNYAYWLFVHTDTEVLQHWPEANPPGYWTPVARLDSHASFGAPHAVGWKAVGALYADATLNGPYETTEDAWAPAWYTRGQDRCLRDATWYFEAGEEALFDEATWQSMKRVLDQSFSKWGVVQVDDAVRLRIYQQTGNEKDQPHKAPEEDLPRVQADVLASVFDANADPWLPLAHPVVAEVPDERLHADLDGKVLLEGYALVHEGPLHPGDVIDLTLFWRAQQPLARSYRVFNQSYYGDGKMIAQADGFPACDAYETWRWQPGELIVDRHELHIRDSAPSGAYPLFTGLYDPETGERLPVLDELGQAVDSQVYLTDITIAGK